MTRSLWQRIKQLFNPESEPIEGELLDPKVLRKLVMGIFDSHEGELDCDGCYEELDQFAETVLSGKNAAEAMPLVHEHLERCPPCREEFEALTKAIEQHQSR